MFAAHDYRGRKLVAARLDALLRTPTRRASIDGLKGIARVPASYDFTTFFALQGEPLVGIGGALEGTYEWGIVDTTKPSLCLVSPADAGRGEAVAYGTEDAEVALQEVVARWYAARKPLVGALRMRVRWKRTSGADIPAPGDDAIYRFARGGASFDAWYEPATGRAP
jgi:hypothetical protein